MRFDIMVRRLVLVAASGILVCSYGPGTVARTAGPVTHTVIMEGLRYEPAALTVDAGDTVVWVNRDMFPHTATAEDGGFDSGLIAAEASWKFTAAEKGAFAYLCTYHPTMKGRLRVE